MKWYRHAKARRMIGFLLLCTFILFAAGCAPAGDPGTSQASTEPSTFVSGNNYEIYLYQSNFPDLLNNPVAAEVLWSPIIDPDANEMKKMIRVDGTDYEMDYDHSYNLDQQVLWVYKTPDHSVDCLYDAYSMELVRILLVKNRSEFETMDQQQYEQWLHTFINQFYQEDLGDYQLDCKVINSPHPIKDATLTEWGFKYRTYIDGIKTSDKLTAYFNLDTSEETMKVCVWFNTHSFDAVDTVNLDQTALDSAISAYLNANMREKYTLEKVTPIGEDELQCINGNIMLKRSVEITYKASGITNTCQCDLLIDIPDP